MSFTRNSFVGVSRFLPLNARANPRVPGSGEAVGDLLHPPDVRRPVRAREVVVPEVRVGLGVLAHPRQRFGERRGAEWPGVGGLEAGEGGGRGGGGGRAAGGGAGRGDRGRRRASAG